MASWQPATTQDVRIARDQLYRQIRAFFQTRGFIEVDPPLLGVSGSSDVHLNSPTLTIDNIRHYLQTSPEFFMKRLLAAGSGPIYALTKSFRQGEQGRHHNLEFTILEWYQPGLDDHSLMQQVSEFIQAILDQQADKATYRECFLQATELNPHTATTEDLATFARRNLHVEWQVDSRGTGSQDMSSRDLWLDLIFSHCIQPTLQTATLIYDYPATQAALAKVAENQYGEPVARRFELFCRGIELGNGYWELTDSAEQERRFRADNSHRRKLGLETVVWDNKLVEALRAGLPDCAGIAVGVDRLLMLKTGTDRLEQVLDFPVAKL